MRCDYCGEMIQAGTIIMVTSPGEITCCTGESEGDSFYRAVVDSPQWKQWKKVSHEYGFNADECQELGKISPEHFEAFIEYSKTL